MENDIKFLRIQNFKSIKDVTLHPRRVNLIIGEPNVGKSNLLEAMTLLGGITYEQTEKFMGSFIRYEEPRQLFYDNLVGNTIKVETDRDVAVLLFESKSKQFEYLFCDKELHNELLKRFPPTTSNRSTLASHASVLSKIPFEHIKLEMHNGFAAKNILYTTFNNASFSSVKIKSDFTDFGANLNTGSLPRNYAFIKNTFINQETGDAYLNPPSGNNLIEIIQAYTLLRAEIAQMFERYGQKLQLRMDERRLEIIKDQDGIIYSYPYSSVADTLQRIIFYLAAIESNDDAVLLFEEPEAHSFPVYVSKLGRRIVESTNNQFFIDTHSPYLITEILETMLTDDAQAGELAMFAAYYEDHQTKVHQLSDEEIRSIRADGIDVFYNMKRFTTGAASNA
ncbi:AAA family ATPase [Hymenobacter siberiensis]|jgi:AAA15 family ATPase/GTPase|uniref:AAA family ATPase n=1 Tax=Hymenobacter siberiensis TaxID=2848396 RepID=UPI001C1E5F2B|nr:AAA family ATPase [Hymenobacter siberiensis]MBU6120585.1 AAA family ATPase [Hymenobacter siberiensis]